MNMNMSKGIFAVALLLVGGGAALPAAATEPYESLGTISTAVDVFAFTCPATTVSASASVEDLTSVYNVAARMQVLLLKDSFTAHAEDSGEGGSPSYNARLFKGSGQYLMLVFKTAEGPEAYRASVVCNTFKLTCNRHESKQKPGRCVFSRGIDPPATIGMTQNQ